MAFIRACQNGRKDVVQLLLDLSIKIELNERDEHGWTVLMSACKKGYKDVVKLLLDHSKTTIDLNVRTIYSNSGTSAFMLACSNGHKNVVQ